jgi:hypothetical protein
MKSVPQFWLDLLIRCKGAAVIALPVLCLLLAMIQSLLDPCCAA